MLNFWRRGCVLMANIERPAIKLHVRVWFFVLVPLFPACCCCSSCFLLYVCMLFFCCCYFCKPFYSVRVYCVECYLINSILCARSPSNIHCSLRSLAAPLPQLYRQRFICSLCYLCQAMQILKFDSVIQTANAITNCKMKQAKTALTMNYSGVHRTLVLIAMLCFANTVLADLANF